MIHGPSDDVLIVGAGIVGCALARELSRYALRVTVLDGEHDVGEGTSKANSAILHTGFDAPAGSLEAALVAEGRALWLEAAPGLHVPIEPVGALMIATDAAERAALVALLAQGRRNGVPDLELLGRDATLAREPHVHPDVMGALRIPGEGITDPFAAVVALAESAAVNGVAFRFGRRVHRIRPDPGGFAVEAGGQVFHTRWLVNAAGLFSDEVSSLAGRGGVVVRARRGEFLVFDRSARSAITGIVLPVPGPISKGILVAPTVFGTVLAGPTATDQESKVDASVTPDGMAAIRAGIRRLVPALAGARPIATYAGLRAVGSSGDYLIDVDGRSRLVTISGIRSTGLTAAPAIARHVVSRMIAAGLPDARRPGVWGERPRPAWIPGTPRPCYDPVLVARDPSFGRVVCLCERVTEGEIAGALSRPLPATTLDAVKRRTWATAGRCQGDYCTADLVGLLARGLQIPPWEVTKRGEGSAVASGPLPPRRGPNPS